MAGRLELGTPIILIRRSHSARAVVSHSFVLSGVAWAWDSGGAFGPVVQGGVAESLWLFCLADSSCSSGVPRGVCGRGTNRGLGLGLAVGG